jgi:hypothetical protein
VQAVHTELHSSGILYLLNGNHQTHRQTDELNFLD